MLIRKKLFTWTKCTHLLTKITFPLVLLFQLLYILIVIYRNIPCFLTLYSYLTLPCFLNLPCFFLKSMFPYFFFFQTISCTDCFLFLPLSSFLSFFLLSYPRFLNSLLFYRNTYHSIEGNCFTQTT